MKVFYDRQALCKIHLAHLHNPIQGLKVNPYFIRLFKRRWYVMSLVMLGKEIHRFGLDRIKRIEVLNSKFSYPKDFSPLDYYIDYYGVFHNALLKRVTKLLDPLNSHDPAFHIEIKQY